MTATRSALFGVVAPTLGWVPPLRYLLRRARILRLIDRLPAAATLVEVGCGSGALLDDLADRGHRVVGLESSARALSMARAIAAATGNGQRVVDAPETGWRGAFDLVCAFDVLEHIEDDGAAIDQWLSWLRAGGGLCLSVPAHRSRWGAGDVWAGHWRRYDRPDLLALMARHGLQVEYIECYGFPLANLTEWLGERTYRRLLAAQQTAPAKAAASADSGVERSDYLRLYRYMNSLAGRVLLRICLWLQAASARTDWGSGYLLLARRR